MQDTAITASSSLQDISNSENSKLEQLIDVPFTKKAIAALLMLFNYFDIYAPRIPAVYDVITIIRFFQLIGGSIMAANTDLFKPGTLTYKVMSVISVLFHVVPVQFRGENLIYILTAIDAVLIVFGVYLVVTAFQYKSTSKVPRISLLILSFYVAIGPFIILPLAAQFMGQMISNEIATATKPDSKELILAIVTVTQFIFYVWMLMKTYTTTIIFRASSLQTLEGTAQNKVILVTLINTLLCAIATDMDRIPQTVITAISMLIYFFSITTVFNCGTFIRHSHQIMILGGSILGIVISAINFYPCFTKVPYKEWYFLCIGIVSLITFIVASLIIKIRSRKDMNLLDEIEDKHSLDMVKSKGKFKQLLITGFSYCHAVCSDFSIFRMAIEKWKDDVDIWMIYAKFMAIYPESTNTLAFIVRNVSTIKNSPDMVKLIQTNVANIINTRETKFTVQLRNKINKINKQFIKTKNRLRNIWDLILQGSTNDMDSPIKIAYQSVKECESDVLYLKMIYPNNRFALKLYARYLLEIKSDVVQYKKTLDDIALLQRGLKINNDTVHDLGMESFPLIPERLTDSDLNIKTADNESGMIEEIDVEEIKDEDYESIVKLIDAHKVPAIQYLYSTSIIAFIFLLLIPAIGICSCFGYFKKSLTDPITYMEGVAYTRNIVNVIPCFAVRCLFEELKDPNNPTENIIGPLTMVPGFPADAFGGEYVGRKIIEFYAKNIGTMNSMISGLRSFKPGNKHIEKVRDLLFARNIIYHFFITKEKVRDIPSSAVDISYQLASTVGRLLDHPVLNVEVAKSSDSLTVRNNNVLITESASKALTSIVQYIGDNHDKYTKIFWGLFAFFSAMNFIFIALIFILQKRKLEKNKNTIITSISELPKTVISSVSAGFSNLKGNHSTSQKASNGHESETNRQEESIIKLFSSISDGVNSSSSYFFLFCYAMIIILSILCFWFAVHCYFSASDVVFYNCHHINYFYGSITFLFALASRLYDICLATYHPDFKDTILDVNQSIKEMETYIPLELTYFHSIRLGGRGYREVPFEGMAEALDRATSIIKCADPLKPPIEVPESTRCFSASNTLYIAVCYFKRFVKLMKQGIFPLPWGYHVNDVFQVGPLELHEAFFSKTGGELVPYMIKSIKKQETNLIRNTVLFVVAALIFLVCILFTISKENTLIKFTIDQLLRVPPSEIMRNQHIMQLLTGDYSEEVEEDFSGKYIQFANEVINRLNDIFIVCQEETGKVIQVNASFTNMFGITNEEIENTNIKDFFIESRFQSDGKLDRVYTRTMNAVYTNANNEKFFIEFSSTNVNGRRIFTGKDQTQNVLHEKLIQDEKDKSNKMLASILPASLVSRVQAGEKDISFAVQSSSVLFLDIVEFTPWCGSHDAHYVMRMLNILFKEFDAICNAHKTMTKIKCIGDCYMAAGGIFDEVNQPAVHAKEVVDFGCVVIKKLEEVNMSENEKLRIRVGVNTGGPIVAGVIGTEKPTFEILGPTINIAHEMEHHGVPMKVHISRPVYELIYGQSFDIKERGEIDVKGGKMFTYLVDP